MSKFQVPTIGGIRKVIRPGAGAPPAGTTIAEFGAQTVSLAQLAAILTNIQTQQAPSNTIGQKGMAGARGLPGMYWQAEDGADGEQGPPGLPGKAGVAGAAGAAGAGGAPGMDGEPGADGDIGPPGVAGQQGIQGVPGVPGAGLPGAGGPALYFTAEDGQDGDMGAPGQPGTPGAAGSAGAAGAAGQRGAPGEDGADGEDGRPGPAGTPGAAGSAGGVGPMSTIMMVPQDDDQDDGMMIYMPSQIGPLTVNGPFLSRGGFLFLLNTGISQAGISAPLGVGAFVEVGGNGNALQVNSLALGQSALSTMNTQILARGNQQLSIGVGSFTTLMVLSSAGDVTVNADLFATGAFKCFGAVGAAAASRTDIGVTTTVTVITTAGGIAIPALASTFWRVNVNGVAYGVPLFAL
jgi:Collagen triple helix repeat (20 copies)